MAPSDAEIDAAHAEMSDGDKSKHQGEGQ
jgi:hypothetical protein